ncbi:MAG: nucleotide excision repair endonuclease [Candidatus Eisenbacteria bacterium]|nr:nucleotide excision repair endonuclease [Candidatus Eisenbacteria bacterium]
MSRGELIERIAAFALEQGESLEARVIAREFLRLSAPDGKGAAALVRALLANDPRFVEESDGRWTCRPAGSASLEPPVALIDFEMRPGTEREPWLWKMRSSLWGRRGTAREHCGAQTSAALEETIADIREFPVATARPGALGRWLGAQERLHALAEIEPVVIDLCAWRGKSVAASLDALGAWLDEVVEKARERKLRSWIQVALAPLAARAAAKEEVWSVERAFGPQDLEALPESAGIYRFYDRADQVLYIGKSANLRRRVMSYFRPLGEASTRREELLARIHRFEIEETANELDALILELCEIRSRKPSWNVQVDLGEEPQLPPGDRAMLFHQPGTMGEGTWYALDGERAARISNACSCDRAELARELDAFFRGSARGPLQEIGSPERVLVRRWLKGGGHGETILRVVDFGSFDSLANAVSESEGTGSRDNASYPGREEEASDAAAAAVRDASGEGLRSPKSARRTRDILRQPGDGKGLK